MGQIENKIFLTVDKLETVKTYSSMWSWTNEFVKNFRLDSQEKRIISKTGQESWNIFFGQEIWNTNQLPQLGERNVFSTFFMYLKKIRD